MKSFLALTVALPVVGLAAAPTSPLIAQAKKVIAAQKVDPSSLQYRDLRTVRKTVDGKMLTIVCGSVNSKNKFGGKRGVKAADYAACAMS